MPESTELTTRDVLCQLNHRMGRVEDDLRSTSDRVNEKIDNMRDELTARFDQGFSRLDTKIDRNFRWGIGISLASWMSIMTTLLLK